VEPEVEPQIILRAIVVFTDGPADAFLDSSTRLRTILEMKTA
jgi:hypothetical protein